MYRRTVTDSLTRVVRRLIEL